MEEQQLIHLRRGVKILGGKKYDHHIYIKYGYEYHSEHSGF